MNRAETSRVAETSLSAATLATDLDCAPTNPPVAAGGRIISRGDGTTAYRPIWILDHPRRLGAHRPPPAPGESRLRQTPRSGCPRPATRLSHLINGGHLDRGRLTWLRRGWPTLFEQLADPLPRTRQLS